MSSNMRGSTSSSRADTIQAMGTPQSSRRLEVVSKQATKVTAISAKLEWKIDQFEKLMKLFKNGHNLISKQFFCPQAPSVVWELHVYPNGKRDEDAMNVSFFLRQVGLQRGEDPIMTEFQIYALDASNARVSVCRDTKDFSNQQGRGKFQVSRDKMIGALKYDGSLLLICEVEYLPPGSKICVEQADEDEFMEDSAPISELSVRTSLKEMFENELFADTVLKVGNKNLKAHRCILGQHSIVFRSMFTQKTMNEAQTGVIDITDSRPEAVRAMLEYIYTGATSPGLMENFAEEILAIADKYAVIPLKEHCERHLASTLNGKNVAEMAIFADTYSAYILKRACTRYISAHHKDVIRSAEWKDLKRERSGLANELLESVLADNTPSDSADSDSMENIRSDTSLRSNVHISLANTSSSSSSFQIPSLPTSYSDYSSSSSSGIGVSGARSNLAQPNDDSRSPMRKRLRRGSSRNS